MLSKISCHRKIYACSNLQLPREASPQKLKIDGRGQDPCSGAGQGMRCSWSVGRRCNLGRWHSPGIDGDSRTLLWLCLVPPSPLIRHSYSGTLQVTCFCRFCYFHVFCVYGRVCTCVACVLHVCACVYIWVSGYMCSEGACTCMCVRQKRT